jgi:hypothetical protein
MHIDASTRAADLGGPLSADRSVLDVSTAQTPAAVERESTQPAAGKVEAPPAWPLAPNAADPAQPRDLPRFVREQKITVPTENGGQIIVQGDAPNTARAELPLAGDDDVRVFGIAGAKLPAIVTLGVGVQTELFGDAVKLGAEYTVSDADNGIADRSSTVATSVQVSADGATVRATASATDNAALKPDQSDLGLRLELPLDERAKLAVGATHISVDGANNDSTTVSAGVLWPQSRVEAQWSRTPADEQVRVRAEWKF